jgi:transposase
LADDTLPSALREGAARQLAHLRELEAHLAECDREISQQARRSACTARRTLVRCRRAYRQRRRRHVVDASQFRCGRQFAAWLGLTPRQ